MNVHLDLDISVELAAKLSRAAAMAGAPGLAEYIIDFLDIEHHEVVLTGEPNVLDDAIDLLNTLSCTDDGNEDLQYSTQELGEAYYLVHADPYL